MIKSHTALDVFTADEFAETIEGVPDILYRKLWNEIVPLTEGKTGWDDFGPTDTRKNHLLVDHWDKFTENEQGTINLLLTNAGYEPTRAKDGALLWREKMKMNVKFKVTADHVLAAANQFESIYDKSPKKGELVDFINNRFLEEGTYYPDDDKLNGSWKPQRTNLTFLYQCVLWFPNIYFHVECYQPEPK